MAAQRSDDMKLCFEEDAGFDLEMFINEENASNYLCAMYETIYFCVISQLCDHHIIIISSTFVSILDACAYAKSQQQLDVSMSIYSAKNV